MDKYIKIISVILLALTGISCGHPDKLIIKGKIDNLDSSYLVSNYLVHDNIRFDTISVKSDGSFTYKCNVDTLTVFSLYMNDYNGVVTIFADAGDKIEVTGDAYWDELIEVTGNNINDDLTEFKSTNRELIKERLQLIKGMHGGERQDVQFQINALNQQLILEAEHFIKDHPNNYSSLVLINNFFLNSNNSQALERVLSYLGENLKHTFYARKFQQYLELIQRSSEGAMVPYFSIQCDDQKMLNSYDLRDKYLLISFVSAQDNESREVIEMLKSEYLKVKRDSVEFLTLYIDFTNGPVKCPVTDSIPWRKAVVEDGWGSDIVNSFNVQYVPFNILIFPDGRIKSRNIPAQNVADVINGGVK